MSGEAKLIIIRGNSGSGKSSAAKLLQRKFGRGTLLIPQDTIRRDLLWVKDEEGTQTISLLIELARFGKENCDIVILEGILYADLYTKLFEVLKAEFTNIYAYYYDLPFEETLARHETKENSQQFGRNEMLSWWREKDFIGIIPEKIICQDLSLNEITRMIYMDVVST